MKRAQKAVTVTSAAPVRLDFGGEDATKTLYRVQGGSDPVYFGNENVTAADGMPFYEFEAPDEEAWAAKVPVYAITAAGDTAVVRVMAVGDLP